MTVFGSSNIRSTPGVPTFVYALRLSNDELSVGLSSNWESHELHHAV